VPDFINRTGVDSIAVTIGNVHGKYAVDPPVLDFERLARTRGKTGIPLVLHGASGIPAGLVHQAIDLGVCKFNVNTEIRGAFMAVVRGRWKSTRCAIRLLIYCMEGKRTDHGHRSLSVQMVVAKMCSPLCRLPPVPCRPSSKRRCDSSREDHRVIAVALSMCNSKTAQKRPSNACNHSL